MNASIEAKKAEAVERMKESSLSASENSRKNTTRSFIM